MSSLDTVINRTTTSRRFMQIDSPVEVYTFEELKSKRELNSLRPQFDMVLWVNKGRGSMQIDYQSYEMIPGRLFLVRQGQVHVINRYAEDGVAVFIQPSRLNLEPSLSCAFYNRPYVDLNRMGCDTFMGLFSFLQIEARNPFPDAKIIENLLNGMLLTLKRQFKPIENCRPCEDLDIVIKVKQLIEKHYNKQRDAEFYSRQLNITVRKLNEIIRTVEGKSVYQLLQDRLLIESRSLLSASRLSVKEIAFTLGFEDPAYFCRFFKKKTGITPHSYREAQSI